MANQNPNPEHSTLIEGLLEAKRSGKFDNSVIDSCIKELRSNRIGLNAADAAVAGKAYSEKSLTFCRLMDFDSCNKALCCSDSAVKMLQIMISGMSQQNLIQVQQSILCDMMQIKERQCRKIIAELKQTMMIVEVVPAKGHTPPIYMINPRIANKSKQPEALVARFWEAEGIDDYHYKDKEFCETHIKKYVTAHAFRKDNNKISYGYFTDAPQKKAVDQTEADDSKTLDDLFSGTL